MYATIPSSFARTWLGEGLKSDDSPEVEELESLGEEAGSPKEDPGEVEAAEGGPSQEAAEVVEKTTSLFDRDG